MPETSDATETKPEHYAARLKREHGEQAEEITRLKARIAELEAAPKPEAVAAPAAPAATPVASVADPLSPSVFVPMCVSALLAGGAKASDLAPLVQAAYATSLALIKDMSGVDAPVVKSIDNQSERKRLLDEWTAKDKEAQGEMMQVRIKRDGAARSTSQVEKERLTEEVKGHESRMRALIAECLILESKRKAIEAAG